MPLPPVPYTELPRNGLDPERFEALWHYRAAVSGVQRVLPDARTDIVVRCRVDPHDRLTASPRWFIAGPTDRARDVPADADSVSIGLRLRPGWAAACLGVPAASLRDRVLAGADAAALWTGCDDLVAQAASASDIDGLVDVLRRMAERIARDRPGDPVQQRAVQAVQRVESDPAMAPSAVALAMNVAERSLRRDVLTAIGLPVRTLCGLARFRGAMDRLRDDVASLGAIALASGYSDQAHMNREFRRFGGFTPGTPGAVPLIGTRH